MNGTAGLLRRGVWLEYATLGWNVLGATVSMWAALSAKSTALLGFGLDSVIEIAASAVVIWQLRGIKAGRERRGLQLIAIAFFGLGVYILVQSVRTILMARHPGSSLLGIVWLTLTLVAMLGLAAGKHRTGLALGNPVLMAEARVTLVDGYLAGAVLASLMLNKLLGWWWADPLAGMVIVCYGFREGFHAWKEATKAGNGSKGAA